jgi:hypothetical protein
MPDTFTTNLNLTKPEVGADDNIWGGLLNDDLDVIDALFASTGTGTVIVRDSSDRAVVSGIALAKAAANARTLDILSSTSLRWQLGATADAESGSNAGSDWALKRYDDSATLLGTSILVERDSGLVTFETTPLVGANSIWHEGNDTSIRPKVGFLQPYLGSTSPNAFWLLAYGQTFVTASYPELATLINGAFDTGGEGTGNMRLPDLRDVTLVGLGNMGGSARGLLTLFSGLNNSLQPTPFGAQEQTILQANLPNVNFTNSGITLNDPQHLHAFGASLAVFGFAANGGSGGDASSGANKTQTLSASTGITVSSQGHAASGGSDDPLTTTQPSLAVGMLVRALP